MHDTTRIMAKVVKKGSRRVCLKVSGARRYLSGGPLLVDCCEIASGCKLITQTESLKNSDVLNSYTGVQSQGKYVFKFGEQEPRCRREMADHMLDDLQPITVSSANSAYRRR